MFFANFDYIYPPMVYMVGKPRISASIWHQAIEIWSILQAVRISWTHPDRLLNSSWHCVIIRSNTIDQYQCAGGRRERWDKISGGEKENKAENSAQAEGRGGQHSTALGSAGPRNISCHWQFATFKAGNSDAVGLFIDQTDSVRYINELNKEHEGPLHFASRSQSLQPETITLLFFIEWSQEWWQTYSGALGEQWSKGDNSKTIFKSLFKIVL